MPELSITCANTVQLTIIFVSDAQTKGKCLFHKNHDDNCHAIIEKHITIRDVEAAISSTVYTPIASNRAWTPSHRWTCWQALLSKPAAYDLQEHVTN